MDDILKLKNEWIKNICNNILIPPIEGDITREEVDKRGLILFTYTDLMKNISLGAIYEKTILMQKGKQIGEPFIFDQKILRP